METQENHNKELVQNVTRKASKDFTRLHSKLLKAGEKPIGKDVKALRNLLITNPEVLPDRWTIHDSLRDQMIQDATRDGANKALIQAEVIRWLNDLGYDLATALERIHMDTIITCRLRMVFAELRQNAAEKSGHKAAIEHHDKMLTAAQNRLNRAIESLARVRRLATQAPVFQVNLATLGGQQVNLA